MEEVRFKCYTCGLIGWIEVTSEVPVKDTLKQCPCRICGNRLVYFFPKKPRKRKRFENTDWESIGYFIFFSVLILTVSGAGVIFLMAVIDYAKK